jgi:hypothetical protein
MRLHSAHLIRGALPVLLAACHAPPEREEIRRAWNTTLQQLGVQPIYPPREDVQIGDIYLRQPAEPHFLPMDLWLAQVDLRQIAADFYANRSHFPDSPTASDANYSRTSEHDTFPSGDSPRLRQVAFPEFASMTVRGNDLEWLVPTEALAIVGGTSWQGGHEITLRVPSVESYGLPANVVLDHVTVERDGQLLLGPGVGLTPAQLQAMRSRQEPGSDPGSQELELEVIREVYFARAIDISISRTSGSGMTTEITFVEAGPSDEEPGTRPDLVERLNARLERTLESTAPGATVRVIGANDASVVLRRTFQRPIAVGFRSFVLSVDPDTGIVNGIDRLRQARSAGGAQGQPLEPALSGELTRRFEKEVDGVEATFDSAEDRWSLKVRPTAGQEERAAGSCSPARRREHRREPPRAGSEADDAAEGPLAASWKAVSAS